MDNREWLGNASGAAPTRPVAPSAGYPQGGVTPTKPGPYWYHQIGESMRAVLVAAGIAPDATVLTLFRDAVNSLIRLFQAATATATGTADALVGAYTPAVPALVNGLTVFARAAAANATTTPTFTPNGVLPIAAKTIVKGNGVALLVGDIAGAGHELQLRYNSTLDKWVLLNPSAGIDLSPAFLKSLSANGYLKLPGGLIVQWGTTSAAAQGGSVQCTYPIAFPNATFAVSLSTLSSGSNTNSYSVSVTSVSTTSFYMTNNSGTSGTVSSNFVAIGY